MRRLLMTALLLPFFAMSLTGCETRRATRLEYIKPVVPPELLTCQDQPAIPPPNATQRDVAYILEDYAEALEDCKRKLGEVFELLSGGK